MVDLLKGGKNMIAQTTNRVSKHTLEHLNERILASTKQSLMFHSTNREAITARLQELDEKWDIERVLEANASSLAGIGVILGALTTPWFYLLSLLVGVFLLQHAIQGWCPPIRLFRRLGFRTHAEIATEYYALRFLRGDFGDTERLKTPNPAAAEEVLRIYRW
jgi:hypothetical protein